MRLLTFAFATTWVEKRSASANLLHIVYLAVDDAVAVSVGSATVQREYLLREDALAFLYGVTDEGSGAEEGRRNHLHICLRAGHREYF